MPKPTTNDLKTKGAASGARQTDGENGWDF